MESPGGFKILALLFASLIIDGVGMGSYIFPALGEASDIIWAPISAWLIFKLYGRTDLALVGFAEEMLPGLDFIPTATIGWCMLMSQIVRSGAAGGSGAGGSGASASGAAGGAAGGGGSGSAAGAGGGGARRRTGAGATRGTATSRGSNDAPGLGSLFRSAFMAGASTGCCLLLRCFFSLTSGFSPSPLSVHIDLPGVDRGMGRRATAGRRTGSGPTIEFLDEDMQD